MCLGCEKHHDNDPWALQLQDGDLDHGTVTFFLRTLSSEDRHDVSIFCDNGEIHLTGCSST